MKKIILASNNKHKIQEIGCILPDYEILSLKDIGYTEDIVEDGNTFLENSLIKAKTIMEYIKDKGYNCDVLADDSGLCVNALDGRPGIYSARYSGDHDNQANRDKIRSELKDKEDRSAYFFCGIILYHQDGTYEYFEGKTTGTIIDEERGNKDFGYDCIFLSDDLNKTFGEATEEEKNSVSHRARALEQLKQKM